MATLEKDIVQKIEQQGYVPLHRHSEYSLLDGSIRIKDLVDRTPFIGAITDHGNMFGFLKYYTEMKKQGKIPIIGMEGYMKDIDGENKRHHVILLCKNNTGYKNLCKLTSNSYEEENFYRKPQITWEDLEKHSEGLVVLSACLGGEIPQNIIKGDLNRAKKVACKFKEIFKDDFYIEIQRHGLDDEATVNPRLESIADELGIKIVATSDAHYLNKEDSKVHEILLCMQTKKTINDPDRFRFKGKNYHLHTKEEMENLFSDKKEYVRNTLEVAKKCTSLELDLGHVKLPDFQIPQNISEYDYFRRLIYMGSVNRGINLNDKKNLVYLERVKKELEVITNMGFIGYFLIVQDFVNYAKSKGILVGPGRGSAAGSLICYFLNITEVDPIRHGLIFERFLNPDRISMPDIDIDFPDDKREEVIEYVRNKYGEDRVSNIITFGTLGAKMVVRDVARTLEYPYAIGDSISKKIPMKPKITLNDCLEDEEFKSFIDGNATNKEIMKYALNLESLPRHSSKHACGVIISSEKISDVIPEAIVGRKGDKSRVTQVTMTECEDLGLLKMDFLGLKTMTHIANTLEAIKKNRGIDMKFVDIPIDDKDSYELLAKGLTSGLFQLESEGMRSFMTRLFGDIFTNKNITNEELFERLTAGISLYRPGPIDYIDDYLAGMRNSRSITYDTKELEPILKSTYGIIVYQEQVMEIARKLAGYTMAGADSLRKSMGKKKREIMEMEKPKFLEGCKKNGISEEISTTIWDKMEKFCQYAFNKSHAVGYAYIAAKTTYLKRYFHEEFMAELLNTCIGNSEKISKYLNDIKSEGLKISLPNINKSMNNYYGKDGEVFIGFSGIKNVGKTGALIEKERGFRAFESLSDFVLRTKDFLDRSSFESLVYAGAFDEIHPNKKELIVSFDNFKSFIKREQKRDKNQFSMFDGMDKVEDLIIKCNDIPPINKALLEEEVLGMIISNHPVKIVKEEFKNAKLYENTVGGLLSGKKGSLIAMVNNVDKRFSKDGRVYISFSLSDENNIIPGFISMTPEDKRMVCFENGNVVTTSGRINTKSYGTTFYPDGINKVVLDWVLFYHYCSFS